MDADILSTWSGLRVKVSRRPSIQQPWSGFSRAGGVPGPRVRALMVGLEEKDRSNEEHTTSASAA